MDTTFIIIISVAIVATIIIFASLKGAEEIKEEKPKFQPRKVTISVSDETEKPKRKKKRYYNKKKKPAVAENAPTEKRPVGRPRKS